jgi:hypothetical protein
MSKDFRVTVNDVARREEWLAIFGTDTMCVESPIPENATLPGLDGTQRIYKLDLAELTDEQRARLVEHIGHKFGLEVDEVNELLDVHGVPILADQCSVIVHNPQKWVG